MLTYPQERLAVFVDGPNLWNIAKTLNIDVDWKKLRQHLSRAGCLVRCAYFTPLDDREDTEFTPLRPLVDWLGYNGWKVITEKSDIHVDLAVAAMEIAEQLDHFILASGDGDYLPLLESLRRRGKRITVLASIKHGCRCNDDLRREADNFLDLDELRDQITRPAREKVPA